MASRRDTMIAKLQEKLVLRNTGQGNSDVFNFVCDEERRVQMLKDLETAFKTLKDTTKGREERLAAQTYALHVVGCLLRYNLKLQNKDEGTIRFLREQGVSIKRFKLE